MSNSISGFLCGTQHGHTVLRAVFDMVGRFRVRFSTRLFGCTPFNCAKRAVIPTMKSCGDTAPVRPEFMPTSSPMRVLAVLGLLGIGALTLSAQSTMTIEGVVVNAATGAGIGGITVFAAGHMVLTDASGVF